MLLLLPVSLLCLNILLRILYSKPLIIIHPLRWEKKFHTHTKIDNILVLRILMFGFLDRQLEDKFWTEL
jgi:hypothetical protein